MCFGEFKLVEKVKDFQVQILFSVIKTMMRLQYLALRYDYFDAIPLASNGRGRQHSIR
jgi:hypothetical protein